MKSCKGVVGLSLLLTAMAVGLPASAAQLKAKTAVLVHGAFADGSCWQKVIPYLEKAGLKVIAVQNPLDSLDNHSIKFQHKSKYAVGRRMLGAEIDGKIAKQIPVDFKHSLHG